MCIIYSIYVCMYIVYYRCRNCYGESCSKCTDLYCVFIDNIVYDLKMQILNSRFTNIERTTKDKTPVKHKSPRVSVQSYMFIVLCKIY